MGALLASCKCRLEESTGTAIGVDARETAGHVRCVVGGCALDSGRSIDGGKARGLAIVTDVEVSGVYIICAARRGVGTGLGAPRGGGDSIRSSFGDDRGCGDGFAVELGFGDGKDCGLVAGTFSGDCLCDMLLDFDVADDGGWVLLHVSCLSTLESAF